MRRNLCAFLVVLTFTAFSNRALHDAAIDHDLAKTKKGFEKALAKHTEATFPRRKLAK